MKIEWRDSFKIGDDEIDAQHQYLFELTNKLVVTDDVAALKLLVMQLYRHSREHFEYEEALMHKLQFPDCKAHTDYHNRLLSRLNDISAAIGKGEVDKRAIQILMRDWAMRHVPHDDLPLAAYVAAQGKKT
jgi:hemerythrin